MAVRKGDSKLDWGTTDETYGLVQAMTRAEAVEVTPAKNGQNDTVAVEYTDNIVTVSGTFLFRDETTSGAPQENVGNGTEITMATTGDSICIESATRDWSFNCWSQISFEGKYYRNLGS